MFAGEHVPLVKHSNESEAAATNYEREVANLLQRPGEIQVIT
jgi:hypothetical protein